VRVLDRLLAWRRTLAFAAAAAVGVGMLASGSGLAIDETATAARSGFRLHPASGAIVIAEIDEKSIAAIARWPWPRRVHAAIVDRLREAGARSIAFDVDFSSPSAPEDDRLFAAALERAGGTVILPIFSQSASTDSEATLDSAPIPMLARHAFLAAANVHPGSDGRLRRMFYGRDIEGAPRPSLAAMIAERQGIADGSFPIDLSIDPASIPHFSAIDLISGRVPAQAVRGRRVLIGATAVELGDRYALPRHGLMGGVAAQAMAAETLLAGQPPREASGLWALLLGLAGLALALKARRLRWCVAAGTGSWLGLAALVDWGEPLLGVRFSVAAGVSALVAGTLAAGVGHFIFRYRERLLVDTETGLPNLVALGARVARGDVVVLALRIDGFATLVAGLGAREAARLVERTADRLRFLLAADSVYRIEPGVLAWAEPPETLPEERLATVAALMRSPELAAHFGAARGSAAEVRRIAANAALAAAAAAEALRPWQVFSRHDSEAVNWSVTLAGELDRAIEAGAVYNAYQPKLSLVSGEVTGVEALVRWNHGERGPIAPDTFIPILEQRGRIADLTLHVLRGALADALEWQRSGRPLKVAVNVSTTLLGDAPAMARLHEAVRDSGLDPARLTIEVTETAAMGNPARAIAALETWRGLGVGVSIDDYGTGQSSLAYLQKLPATELKIDRSFVAGIAREPRSAAMVRSTVALAHELGLEVVAEGVEDEACLASLRETGCDLAQGYFIARPMRAGKVLRFVEDTLRRRAAA
jgi:EAL domain-containing protein (putative c-di-GMP-specific phosphodiesterase class I)/CHASE2 domain-containing sensor protein